MTYSSRQLNSPLECNRGISRANPEETRFISTLRSIRLSSIITCQVHGSRCKKDQYPRAELYIDPLDKRIPIYTTSSIKNPQHPTTRTNANNTHLTIESQSILHRMDDIGLATANLRTMGNKQTNPRFFQIFFLKWEVYNPIPNPTL